MKVILIPDSFKGTLSSRTVCAVMEQAVRECGADMEIVSIPVADGGEGTVDCFLSALGGREVPADVTGVWGEPMTAFYGMLPDRTAVIEMASCAGLPLVKGRPDPEKATTCGVGGLMLAAAGEGAKQIIVGLGGSATNDGGCGAATAAGVVFRDSGGRSFIPTGGNLCDIDRIDLSGLAPALRDIPITVMCDIDNPLYGETGAAFVFGPQKGADTSMVRRLDNGLRHLCKKIQESTGRELSGLPGGGAAGGMGAGMCAFFGAELKMGIDTVLDTVNYESQLQGASLVFTGEGRIDGQSLRGKVISGVALRARKHGAPVVAVVGAIGPEAEKAYALGVTAMFSINTAAVDFTVSRHDSEKNLLITMRNIMRLVRGVPVKGFISSGL